MFSNCSSRIPNFWDLRDVQSLDTKIMNTKQWLKTENSNYKYLHKVMKNELKYYKENDLKVFQDLAKEMKSINKALENIKSYLNKQIKLATKIKKRPSLAVFNSKNKQKKKVGLFARRKNKGSIGNKSERALKIINSLQNNSSVILENQSNYNESIDRLNTLFAKKKRRLVFIRIQINEWDQQLKDLMHDRERLIPTLNSFNLILSEALFKSSESGYAKNIIDLSKSMERYNDEMDRFESYVKNIESIAGKEVKGLVYIINAGDEKKYEKKYKKELSKYQNILKEVTKLINSI